MIIVKSLYGLRTSAARFHKHLGDIIQSLGFRLSKADPNFWIQDKRDHYEYLASYVNDILVWSKDPMAVMEDLKKVYTMKGVGIPEYYLGGDVESLMNTGTRRTLLWPSLHKHTSKTSLLSLSHFLVIVLMPLKRP